VARPDLFTVGSLRAVELDRDGLPALQRLFEANRDYFLDVEGHEPADDEALRALEDDPTPGMPFDRKWDGEWAPSPHPCSDFALSPCGLIRSTCAAGSGTSAIRS
jgi:hypothetical protein